MAHRTMVMLVVGLTESVLSERTPRLSALRDRWSICRLRPPLPAVTCTAQSSMLTGLSSSEHGVVANGWYDRESAEVRFWKQSNHLVKGEKVWETARRRDPSVTCAQMFWWYNMYTSADWSVTPRPMYKADGRKIPDCYAEPPELRDELQEQLGRFPLFQFWGPGSSIASSAWIADAALAVDERQAPTLSLVYLPHLDYAHQKHGPEAPESADAAAEIDAVVGRLLDRCERDGIRPIVLSEYGIEPVDDAVHINRALREAGLVRVREEEGLEQLDAGASRAFALADHQIAHVYVRDAVDIDAVRSVCEGVDGVDLVLDADGKRDSGLDHERSGELVLVAAARRWFSYYYWLDDARAPDFARTVDIHRKPGYDPVELFIDPKLNPKLAIGTRLIRKKLGFRTLMDVIPLDASLVRGSHGRVDGPSPIMLSERTSGEMASSAVRDVILDHLFGA